MAPPTKFSDVPHDPALYRDWRAGPGAALMEKVRTGVPLIPEEDRAEILAVHALLHQAKAAEVTKLKSNEGLEARKQSLRDFWEQTRTNGQAVLRRAYTRGQLTAAELRVVRRYAQLVALMGTGGELLPYELSLAAGPFGVGQPAPDFCADTEDAFDFPALLAAGNPNHVYDALTDWIVLEPLQLVMSYRPTGDGKVEPREEVWPLRRPDTAFRMRDAIGERPLVLILAHPSDYWAWHFTLAPELEMLHRALAERARFVLVNVSVHDTVMTAEDPFPSPARPGKALGGHRTSILHPVTVEERARVAGLLKMALPFFSIPMVFDHPGQTIRNAFRDRGGEATFVVVDRDGRVVYWDRANLLPKTPFYSTYRWQRLQALAARVHDLGQQGGGDSDPRAWVCPTLWQPTGAGPAAVLPIPDGVTPAVAARTHLILAGELQEREGNRLHVATERPDLAANLALWDTPGARAPGPDSQLRLDALRAWLQEGWPEVFMLAEGALIMRNGHTATPADLRPGDRLGFRTRAAWIVPEPHPVDMLFAFGP